MRPCPTLTMCAFSAVAAATGLAAPAHAAAQSNYFIRLDGIDVPGATAGEREKHIEISSWQWGTTSGAKFGAVGGMHRDSDMSLKGSKVGQNSADGDPDRPLVAGRTPNANEREMKESGEKGGTEDINIGVGELQEAGPAGVGGSEKQTVGANRSPSAGSNNKLQELRARAVADIDQAPPPAEKRQHGWVTVSRPLDRGSVRVKVKFPWVGCAVGARYPAITLGDGTRNYRLQDVTVASCGGAAGQDEGPEESITFVYGKLGVK